MGVLRRKRIPMRIYWGFSNSSANCIDILQITKCFRMACNLAFPEFQHGTSVLVVAADMCPLEVIVITERSNKGKVGLRRGYNKVLPRDTWYHMDTSWVKTSS